MAFRHRTLTVEYSGEEESDLIDAFLAGMRLRAWIQEQQNTEDPSDAVGPPGLQVDLEGVGHIVIPPFTMETGYTYRLESSDDDFASIKEVITDGATPESAYDRQMSANLRFRVVTVTPNYNLIGPATNAVP